MSESADFTEKLKAAITEKTTWYNLTELPRMLENYRLLHTCVKNLYETLVKRSLITPDPYKLDKKISGVQAPDETPYAENERSVIIGARFSDYESMLDFICTYYKFSVDNFDIPKMKKFNELNNSFQWNNMNGNSTKVNTRGLSNLINEVRLNMPQLSLSMINDSISKSAVAMAEITGILKDLNDFKREEYKLKLRLEVLKNPTFNTEKASSCQAEEIAEIKRLFPQVMGKQPYYSELVSELADEDLSPNRDKLQQSVLNKLVVKQVVKEKETEKVDQKIVLLDTIHILTTLSPEYATIAEKISTNSKILEGAKKGFITSLKKTFRKAFKIPDPPLIYKFIIVDQKKQTKTPREVDINIFISNLQKKANFLSILANKQSVEYKKITNSQEDQLLAFVNKQLSEGQEMLLLLTASDDFFKASASPLDRPKIKGLKIDLVTVKNALVKANQRRAEYVTFIEEQKQMQKLGIEE